LVERPELEKKKINPPGKEGPGKKTKLGARIKPAGKMCRYFLSLEKKIDCLGASEGK